MIYILCVRSGERGLTTAREGDEGMNLGNERRAYAKGGCLLGKGVESVGRQSPSAGDSGGNGVGVLGRSSGNSASLP